MTGRGDVLKTYSTRQTPQTLPADGASTRNAAGGYTFAIDDMARLRRFLTLGSSGATYYTKASELTRDNADVVVRLARTDPVALVDAIVEVSVAGRAPRQNPAIFALAIAAKLADDAGRAYALSKLSEVCRTGTHLFLFVGYAQQFGGWGRGFKRAVAQWITAKPADKLAYQYLKYRQREGWQWRDVLRLARPTPPTPEVAALHDYLMVKAQGGQQASDRALVKYGHAAWSPHAAGHFDLDKVPRLVIGYEALQNGPAAEATRIVRDYDIAWEMVPDRLLNEPAVWEALLDKGVPITALMRQLPRLTRLGLTTSASYGPAIAARLTDGEVLKRGRVHPINVLVAQRTYASGHSARGDTSWTPTGRITDALDAAFYTAYGAVEPSGKRILLACDVSGSMGYPVSGLPLTCREAVAALALVTVSVERDCEVVGFSDGTTHNRNRLGWGPMLPSAAVAPLDITPRRRLDDVCTYMSTLAFGATDCALPYVWAMKARRDFDAVWVLTDNETWYGKIHPHQALRQYRQQVGHDVKSGVVAMTSTGYSIADPTDPSSLDVAGFDANVPQVMSAFSAGHI